MKASYLKTVVAAFAISVAMAGSAHAQIVGQISDPDPADPIGDRDATVGTSNITAGPHVAGRPGIGVPAMSGVIVDFQGLQSSVGTDANGVSTINSGTSTPSDHSNIGVFHFAKVSGANLYYGEWSQSGNISGGDQTVYYAGDATGTTVPTSGTATYSVNGISDYTNNGQLSGTFTANFGTNSLTGSLANSGNSYVLNIGTATISGSGFSSNNAALVASGNLVTGGATSGRFFGSNAAALAGITSFANPKYDVAFGGTKN